MPYTSPASLGWSLLSHPNSSKPSFVACALKSMKVQSSYRNSTKTDPYLHLLLVVCGWKGGCTVMQRCVIVIKCPCNAQWHSQAAVKSYSYKRDISCWLCHTQHWQLILLVWSNPYLPCTPFQILFFSVIWGLNLCAVSYLCVFASSLRLSNKAMWQRQWLLNALTCALLVCTLPLGTFSQKGY